MTLQKFILGLLAASLFISCKEDVKETASGRANFAVELQNFGQTVSRSDTMNLNNGDRIFVSSLKVYFTEIKFENNNGEIVLAKDVVLSEPGSEASTDFSVNLPPGNYTKIHLGVGVDSAQNASDPLSFPNEHPLSSYQGMYWDMIKYRFGIVEGRVIEPNGNEILVSYHPGTDSLYTTMTYPVDISSETGLNHNVDIKVNIEDIFDGPGGTIDFHTQPSTHSVISDPHDYNTAMIIMANLSNAIELSTSVSID